VAEKTKAKARPEDALAFLKQEHKALETLSRAFDAALSSEASEKVILGLVADILKGLRTHTRLEEDVFYPVLIETEVVEEPVVLVNMEQHHVWDLIMNDLEATDVSDPRFIPRIIVLVEYALEHMQEEEEELFPEVRRLLGKEALLEMGQVLRDARERLG